VTAAVPDHDEEDGRMIEPGWARVPDDVAYRTIREDVTALLATASLTGPDGVADVPVPACPGWSVRDAVSHLVEVSARVLARASGSPAQVPPPGASLAQLLDVWRRLGEGVEAHMRAQNGRGTGGIVTDSFTHEVDLYYAVGAPVPTEHAAYPRALGVLTRGFGESVRAHELPAVRVVCDGMEWVSGAGEPALTLTAARHDLHRSFTGRRTHGQLAALDWSDDPSRWLPAFRWGPFAPPDTPGDVVSARS
jgi:uncharacterized protein (TIGR03083 family)